MPPGGGKNIAHSSVTADVDTMSEQKRCLMGFYGLIYFWIYQTWIYLMGFCGFTHGFYDQQSRWFFYGFSNRFALEIPWLPGK